MLGRRQSPNWQQLPNRRLLMACWVAINKVLLAAFLEFLDYFGLLGLFLAERGIRTTG